MLNVPIDLQRGDWDSGLHKYENQFFIFANIGISGRTGHEYDNYWDGDLLYWQATKKSNASNPQMNELLNGGLPVLIFTRTEDRAPFTYFGKGTIEDFEDVTPVRAIWKFVDVNEPRPERLPEEVMQDSSFWEGGVKTILVNKHERNPEARRKCLEHFGLNCSVCEFNFEETFGSLGEKFIHVHHLKRISEISKEYQINPLRDLIPVCPNCHAMIHKRNPPIKIDELRLWIQKIKHRKLKI